MRKKDIVKKTVAIITLFLPLVVVSTVLASVNKGVTYKGDTRKVWHYVTWEIEISRLNQDVVNEKSMKDSEQIPNKLLPSAYYVTDKGERETILLKSDLYLDSADVLVFTYDTVTNEVIGEGTDYSENTLFTKKQGGKNKYFDEKYKEHKAWENLETAPKGQSHIYIDKYGNLICVANYKRAGYTNNLMCYTVFPFESTIKEKLLTSQRIDKINSSRHTKWASEWESAIANNEIYYVGYDVVNSYSNGTKYAGVVDNWTLNKSKFITYQGVDQYDEIANDRTGEIFWYGSHNLSSAQRISFSSTAVTDMNSSYGLAAKFSGSMEATIIYYDVDTGETIAIDDQLPEENEKTKKSFTFDHNANTYETKGNVSKAVYSIVKKENGKWDASAFTTIDEEYKNTKYQDAASNDDYIPINIKETDNGDGTVNIKCGLNDGSILKSRSVIYVPCKKDDTKMGVVKFLIKKESSTPLYSVGTLNKLDGTTGTIVTNTGTMYYEYYEVLDDVAYGEFDAESKSLKYTIESKDGVGRIKVEGSDGVTRYYKPAVKKDGGIEFYGITTNAESAPWLLKYTPNMSHASPWTYRPMYTYQDNLNLEIKDTLNHADAVEWYEPGATNCYPTSYEGYGTTAEAVAKMFYVGEPRGYSYSEPSKEVTISNQYDPKNSDELSMYTIMYIVVEPESGGDPEAVIQYVDQKSGKTVRTEEIDKSNITPANTITPEKVKDKIEATFKIGSTDYTVVKESSKYKAEAFTNVNVDALYTSYEKRNDVGSLTANITWSGTNFTVKRSGNLKKYTVIYVLCNSSAPASDHVTIIKNPGGTNVSLDESGSDYAAPDIRAYNTTNQFDLGTAIPTTDSFTVGIDCDTWYGEVEASSHEYTKKINVTISVNGTYHWTTSYWVSTEKGGYSVTEHHYKPVTRSYTYTWDYGGATTYWAVDKVNLFELDNSTVENGCYDGTKGFANNITIPYRLVTNPWTGNGISQYDYRVTGTSFLSSIPRYVALCHVEIPHVETSLYGGVGVYDSYGALYSAMEYEAKKQFNRETKGKYLVPHSDTLELNGKTYINEKNGLLVSIDSNKQHLIGKESNDKFKDDTTTTIPKETPNGLYSTVLTSNYHRILKTLGNAAANKKKFVINDRGEDELDETGDETKNAIKTGYTQNEPVAVHSPVISPFHITDGEDKTQSARVNPSLTQLIPDNWYHVQFDFDNLFERYEGYVKGYSLPAGFTKYVDEKEVRFPFPVKMGDTYYPLMYEGYTDWISLGADCVEFDFYLPTWAKTGIYDSSYSLYGNRSDVTQKSIQTRVWANNSSDVRNAVGYEYNMDRSLYVADYDYPVQISLIAYDFKVLAVSDEISFGDDGNNNDYHNLVKTGAERRVGVNNRLGTNAVRYTYGEDVTTLWNTQYTLPFALTKSEYPLMGELHAGDFFSYSLKTISGGIDRENDYIEIIPTYRYVSTDGKVTEADDLAFYFNFAGDQFIPYGGSRDVNSEKQTSYLGSVWYKFATCIDPYNTLCSFTNHSGLYCGRYINGFDLTSRLTGKSISDVAYTKVQLGNVSHITLTSDMMLYSGDEKELEVNMTTNAENVSRYNGRYNSLGTLAGNSKTYFDESMQEWYGTYYIPNRIFVAPRHKEDGSTFSLYTENGINGWFSEHGEGNAYITEEDIKNIFMQDGYLVLNFKFNIYRDGELDATYYANDLDMWQRENGGNGFVYAYDGSYAVDDTTGSLKPTGTPAKIKLRSGDIAIINVRDAIKNNQAHGKTPGLLWLD